MTSLFQAGRYWREVGDLRRCSYERIVNKPPAIFVFCFALLLFGAYMSLRSSASHEDVVTKVFGTQQHFDAFVNSPQVTAQRLHPSRKEGPNPGSWNGYEADSSIPIPPA